MIQLPFPPLRSSMMVSMPSFPGITMSMKMRSNACSATIRRHSSPFAAVITRAPACSKVAVSRLRKTGSSSTISTANGLRVNSPGVTLFTAPPGREATR